MEAAKHTGMTGRGCIVVFLIATHSYLAGLLCLSANIMVSTLLTNLCYMPTSLLDSPACLHGRCRCRYPFAWQACLPRTTRLDSFLHTLAVQCLVGEIPYMEPGAKSQRMGVATKKRGCPFVGDDTTFYVGSMTRRRVQRDEGRGKTGWGVLMLSLVFRSRPSSAGFRQSGRQVEAAFVG